MEMSDTTKLADETKKLLDSNWTICIFKNSLGSYTAVAMTGEAASSCGVADSLMDAMNLGDIENVFQTGVCVTDDFEPSQALYRLTEKVFGRIV